MVSISPVDIRQSLAKNRAVIIGQVTRLLDLAIATGEDAAVTAKKVRAYFSPWYSNIRKPTGGLLRQGRVGQVVAWPAQAGMASQHSRLVMLTETSKAHSTAVVKAANEQGRWVERRLGAFHPRADLCDGLAGIYPPDEVPRTPTHPRCRCWLRSVPVPRGR